MSYRQRTKQAKVRIRATITETIMVQKEVEVELEGARNDADTDVEGQIEEVAYEKTIWDGVGSGWKPIDGIVDRIEWEVIDE